METGLSLGSNLGDRRHHLVAARDAIARLPGVRVVASSRLYETEPVDVPPSAAGLPFLNAVVIVETEEDPLTLYGALHDIETRLGRTRGPDRNAPRTVDIDLLYAGDRILRTPALTVPHPHWNRRRFVVEPLHDLRPDLVLPGETRSVRAVLLSLPPSPKVVVIDTEW